jgi:glycine cleavage system H protein
VRDIYLRTWRRGGTQLIHGSYLAKKYTKDHEAVVFDDSTRLGTVTITDYAQSSLGDVVFVELPAVGTKVTQGGKRGFHATSLSDR